MARFRYSMQNILNLREKMEAQEKQAFALQMQRLQEEEEAMERLQLRQQELICEGEKLRRGTLNVLDIRDNTRAKEYLELQIKQQTMRLKAAQKNLEVARIRMQKAMQEREIQEKLREKAYAEFLLEENRREAKEIDELTSYTYGKNKKQENE